MESKTTEDLAEIADRLMLACPRFGGDERPLTPEEVARLENIVGPMSQRCA